MGGDITFDGKKVFSSGSFITFNDQKNVIS